MPDTVFSKRFTLHSTTLEVPQVALGRHVDTVLRLETCRKQVSVARWSLYQGQACHAFSNRDSVLHSTVSILTSDGERPTDHTRGEDSEKIRRAEHVNVKGVEFHLGRSQREKGVPIDEKMAAMCSKNVLGACRARLMGSLVFSNNEHVIADPLAQKHFNATCEHHF